MSAPIRECYNNCQERVWTEKIFSKKLLPSIKCYLIENYEVRVSGKVFLHSSIRSYCWVDPIIDIAAWNERIVARIYNEKPLQLF